MTIIGFLLLFRLFPYAIGNVGIVGGNDAVLGQFPYQGNLLKGVLSIDQWSKFVIITLFMICFAISNPIRYKLFVTKRTYSVDHQ